MRKQRMKYQKKPKIDKALTKKKWRRVDGEMFILPNLLDKAPAKHYAAQPLGEGFLPIEP